MNVYELIQQLARYDAETDVKLRSRIRIRMS